jgi:hypothetical protein
VVHAYIEICPFDLVKYEVDKLTAARATANSQRVLAAGVAHYIDTGYTPGKQIFDTAEPGGFLPCGHERSYRAGNTHARLFSVTHLHVIGIQHLRTIVVHVAHAVLRRATDSERSSEATQQGEFAWCMCLQVRLAFLHVRRARDY